MKGTRVVVTCGDCSFESTHTTLRSARSTLDDHRTETGHPVDWRIESLSDGVERAGAAAGVCGIPGLADEDSPLLQAGQFNGDCPHESVDETDLDRAGDDEDCAGNSR